MHWGLFYLYAMRVLKLLLPVLLIVCKVSAQNDDYVNSNVLRYDDFIYKGTIATVQFHESSWDQAAPIIALNSAQLLTLAFDDLDVQQKQYTIGFVHCNADWTPSSLMQGEYLGGNTELNILNFQFSQNSMQTYAHYAITFPQQGLQFTKSGNYLLLVFVDGNREDVVITRRFMVIDDKLQFAATIRQSMGAGQFSKQQLDFSINSGNYDITNPYKDMAVLLMQNNRWDNARYIQPTFVNGKELSFSLDDKSCFNGGNEFRYFDCRSVRFLTERVKDIYRDKDMKNHVVLVTDEFRSTKPYLYYNDLNGAYQIRNSETSGDMDVMADYVYVDFFLACATPLEKGNMYVMGKLTDWRMNPRSKMTYNDIKLGYEARLYLKQGYYNYMYVQSTDGKSAGDETQTEGSYWDTENDYYILVYHRKFGGQYDQLIGYKKINTLRR